MRRLLLRLAWLCTRALLVLALCFAVLSSATHSTREDWRSTRIENLQLPLFVNLGPIDLRSKVKRLVADLSHGESANAQVEFERLGAAAFPLVLAEFSQLPSAGKLRIATALMPVAKRMGLMSQSDGDDISSAPQVLERVWYERSADFQTSIVSRWVARLARRDNVGLRASVLEYDTYALPALMGTLTNVAVNLPIDLQAARRLTDVASRVTGLPWTIPSNDDEREARLTIDRWNRWWQLHQTDYLVLEGPARWSAMLTETQFGKWLVLLVSFRFGQSLDGQSISPPLIGGGWHTLVLLFCSSVGPWLVTILPVGLFARERSARRAIFAELIGLAMLTAPPVTVIAYFSLACPWQHSILAAGVAITFATTVTALGALICRSVRTTSTASSRTSDAPQATKDRRSRSPFFRLLRQWHFAGHSWPFSLLLAFFAERAFRVHGLSQIAVQYFRQRDLHGLMAISTYTAVCLLLVEFTVQLRRKNNNWDGSRKVPRP